MTEPRKLTIVIGWGDKTFPIGEITAGAVDARTALADLLHAAADYIYANGGPPPYNPEGVDWRKP